jgi:MFS family permease
MTVGVGEASLSPSAYSLLSDYFSREKVPFAVGVFSIAPFIGIGLANMVAGPLVEYLEGIPPVVVPGIGVMRSWQLAFLVVGAPGLLFALVALTVREPPRKGRISEGKIAEAVSTKVIFRYILDHRAFFALHFCGLLSMAMQAWMLFAWVAEFFIRTHAMPRGAIGTVYGMILLIFGTTGSIAAGKIATGMIRRGVVDATLRLVAVSAAVLTPLAIAMPIIPDTKVALVLLAIITFFMAWPPGLAIAALQVTTPNEFRGRVIAGTLVVTNFLSFTLGPLLVGLFNDHVFKSEAAIGKTLTTLAAFFYPLATIAFILCLRHFRRLLKKAQHWD